MLCDVSGSDQRTWFKIEWEDFQKKICVNYQKTSERDVHIIHYTINIILLHINLIVIEFIVVKSLNELHDGR